MAAREFLLGPYDRVWINQKLVPPGTFNGYSFYYDSSRGPSVTFNRLDGHTATYSTRGAGLQTEYTLHSTPSSQDRLVIPSNKGDTIPVAETQARLVPLITMGSLKFYDFSKALSLNTEPVNPYFGSDGVQSIQGREFKKQGFAKLDVKIGLFVYRFDVDGIHCVIINPRRRIMAIYSTHGNGMRIPVDKTAGVYLYPLATSLD